MLGSRKGDIHLGCASPYFSSSFIFHTSASPAAYEVPSQNGVELSDRIYHGLKGANAEIQGDSTKKLAGSLQSARGHKGHTPAEHRKRAHILMNSGLAIEVGDPFCLS